MELLTLIGGMTRSNTPFRFVLGADDIRQADRLHQLIIAGPRVFVALATSGITPENPDKWVEQQSRPVTSKLLGETQDSLRVWIKADLLNAIRGRRPLLAYDHYLRFGFAQRTDTVVLGGAETIDGVFLEILIFRNGRLISIDDRRLSQRDHRNFTSDIELVFRDIQNDYRGYRIVIAAPIQPLINLPSARSAEYIGEAVFQRRVATVLNYGDGGGLGRQYGLPALIAAGSMVMYLLAVGGSWQHYIQVRNEFRAISQGEESFDDARLALLQSRRLYLDTPLQQQRMMEHASKLASVLASIENLNVRRLYVKGAMGSADTFGGLSEDANFAFEAELLATDGAALEQIDPTLDRISTGTGAKTLRLLRKDSRSDAGKQRLRVLVEGVAHDA